MSMPEDIRIRFNFLATPIVNPFLDIKGELEVNPVEYYGKWFLYSDWLNKDRVKALQQWIEMRG